MKYMGSKSRIARHIVPIIQEYIDKNGNGVYVEPFVGGANVIDKIKCEYRVGADINKYLIALFRYIQSGGALPDMISREEYADVRANKEKFDPWLVGCVGFLASYNGKFFGGYAGEVHTKAGTTRNYYDEARRNVLQQAAAFSEIEFIRFDYRKLGFTDCVIYCDPPYAGTTQYGDSFNHSEFWDTMRKWSKNNVVLISEETAPTDFKVIWQGNVKRTQDNASRSTATEKLFIYERGIAQ